MMPVHNEMVPAYFLPILATGISQFVHDVPFKGCRHNIEIYVAGIEQTKPIMMLRRDNNVFHASIFSHANPYVRIHSA